jgi:hypothetical protein
LARCVPPTITPANVAHMLLICVCMTHPRQRSSKELQLADAVPSQVLFPTAPRSVLSGLEAELPRSRDELWDLVGVPLRVNENLLFHFVHICGHVAGTCRDNLACGVFSVASISHLQLTPAELDTIISVAAGGGGGAGNGFASVADCMSARQALRPAAGAHIIS